MSKEKKSKSEKKEDYGAPCCKGCALWPAFGKKCHYFWENKKQCTMWVADLADAQSPNI